MHNCACMHIPIPYTYKNVSVCGCEYDDKLEASQNTSRHKFQRYILCKQTHTAVGKIFVLSSKYRFDKQYAYLGKCICKYGCVKR